ncbi:GNAT family N-acetyltransferase [Deinococcus pimensis]|uniref:GNAT family N-acetyltransferase n=1 Tax=Deinococcus pimensis TaxID=309888 RepID=UPI0004881095|nr:GNAT family N-acetyltransferase [Deinococcus pimensis]
MTTITSSLDVQLRSVSPRDAAALARLYNHGVASRLFTYVTEETTPERQFEVIDEAKLRYPFLVAVTDGQVAGYARLSPYGGTRPWHRGLGEVSIVVAPEFRGQGVGARLVSGIVDAARDAGFWKVVSLIFEPNMPSLSLFRRAGFRDVGVYERHGNLHGTWVNVVILERLILENQD